MPDPVFDASDRVPTTVLPAELKGVTDPIKIAEYYQRREAALRTELRATPPKTAVTIEPAVTPTPVAPTATFSVAEAQAARTTLIAAARNTAMAGKKYWSRLSADIEAGMAKLAPEDQVNSMVWETYYNTLVGMNIAKLQEEDRAAESEAQRIAAERSAAPASPAATPTPLPIEVTSKVIPGLGIDEKRYRDAEDHIRTGRWPLTAENINGPRTTIGGK